VDRDQVKSDPRALHTHLLIISALHGVLALFMTIPLYHGIALLLSPLPLESLNIPNPTESIVGIVLIIFTGGIVLLLYFVALPMLKAFLFLLPYLLITLGLMMVPHLLAIYGLMHRRNWGRVLSVGLCAVLLLAFPFGTIAGGYALWVLLRADTAAQFTSAGPPAPKGKAAPKGLFLKDN
jgi:hypothetical protein